MTKRSLFNSCLCACIGIAAFGVVVLARSSSIESTVCCFPLLEMEALWWITMMGTPIFLYTWEFVQYMILSQILPCYKFLLESKVPMTQFSER